MKKRLFSAVQPSGNLHIGNYLGAIRQWTRLQDDYEAIFSVVDLHAITVPQDPAALRAKTLEVAKIYLAGGIDPRKCTLFVQSHVAAHAELAWILNTIVMMGELDKMTQFKEKARKNILKKKVGDQVVERHKMNADEYVKYVLNRVGVGLFDYPVLMAADILLYDTAVVPVGEDQLQHIELARTLARRFNERFGETFVVPEGVVQKEGARIMGLDDPTKKMSKSASSEYNYIALTDDADTVRKKIRKAVTDSGSEVVYQDDPVKSDETSDHGASKPAIRNLINIYSLLSEKGPQEIVEMYRGKGYGDFKTDLAEVVVEFLAPFQERLRNISDDEALAVLRSGAEKARAIAEVKMRTVKECVGLLLV